MLKVNKQGKVIEIGKPIKLTKEDQIEILKCFSSVDLSKFRCSKSEGRWVNRGEYLYEYD